MKGGDIFRPVVRVLNAGVAVTGLTTASFTVTGYLGTAAGATPTFTATEISAGRYRINITTPTLSGAEQWYTVEIASGSYYVEGAKWAGMLRLHTIGEIHSLVSRPVVLSTGSTGVPVETSIDLVAYRNKPLAFQILEQDGVTPVPVGASYYSNWRWSVWDRTHAATRYTLSSGITGDDLGNVAWEVPEDASFFTQIDAAITAGEENIKLYHDLVADAGGVAGKTRTLLRGALILSRFESAA